jgi:hypothetical protein
MRSRRGLLAAALLLLAVAALVGWLSRGSDGSEGELTHTQFVEEANAICARLARENDSLLPPPRPYDEQSVDFFAGLHDNVVAAKDELDALDGPAADDASLGRLVDLYGTLDVHMDQVESAASVEDDQEVIVLLDEIGVLTREMADHERALGICPGKTSARVSISAMLRRTRPNPLTETGTLGPG